MFSDVPGGSRLNNSVARSRLIWWWRWRRRILYTRVDWRENRVSLLLGEEETAHYADKSKNGD